MDGELPDEEYERVLGLSQLKRIAYLMKTIAAEGRVWTLARGGEPVVLGEPGAPDSIPVWPHARFARDLASVLEDGDEPLSVPLDEWLETWIPRLRERRQTVALFPLADRTGGELDSWQFEEEIREALEGPLPLP